MNKQDRKQFSAAEGLALRAAETLRELGEAERVKFEEMPENLQASESGEKFEAAADALEMAAEAIDSALFDARGELGIDA